MTNPTVASFGGFDPVAAGKAAQGRQALSYTQDEFNIAAWAQRHCPASMTTRQKAIIEAEAQAQAVFSQKQTHFSEKAGANPYKSGLSYDAQTASQFQSATAAYKASLATPQPKTLSDFMKGGRLTQSEELRVYLKTASHVVKRQAKTALSLTHDRFNQWLLAEHKNPEPELTESQRSIVDPFAAQLSERKGLGGRAWH